MYIFVLISKCVQVDREVSITTGKRKEGYALDCQTMEWDEVSKERNLFIFFFIFKSSGIRVHLTFFWVILVFHK